jgi:hypothetical protein
MKELNIDKYLDMIKKYSIRRDLEYIELGVAYDDPIVFLKTKDDPTKLVCGGIHGDEQSGSYSILMTIMDGHIPSKTAFLPMISPSACRRGRRRNIDSLDVNRGWGKSSKPLSKEGEIITANVNTILPHALNGILSIHETIGKKYMLFVNNSEDKIWPWMNSIIELAKEKFTIIEDNSDKDFLKDYPKTKNGIILNASDSSFEGFMYSLRCNPILTSEVPQKTSLKDRAYVNMNTIQIFCRNLY